MYAVLSFYVWNDWARPDGTGPGRVILVSPHRLSSPVRPWSACATPTVRRPSRRLSKRRSRNSCRPPYLPGGTTRGGRTVGSVALPGGLTLSSYSIGVSAFVGVWLDEAKHQRWQSFSVGIGYYEVKIDLPLPRHPSAGPGGGTGQIAWCVSLGMSKTYGIEEIYLLVKLSRLSLNGTKSMTLSRAKELYYNEIFNCL